ncbi:MAG: FAD-binding protein [Bacteroidia bacterium]
MLFNISLKKFNTFGIDVTAKEFVEVKTVDELRVLIINFNLQGRKLLILGGGSNILLTKNFEGMVIRIGIKGINIVKEDEEFVWVKAMAGEAWHDLVLFSVSKGYGGIENLSLIPGCVGAAPMQNIGARVVENLEASILASIR